MRFGSAPSSTSLSSSGPKPTWQPSRRSEEAARKEAAGSGSKDYSAPPAPWSPKATASFATSPNHAASAAVAVPVDIPGGADSGAGSLAGKAKREAQRDLRMWLASCKKATAIATADGLRAFFAAHPRHKAAMLQGGGSLESFVQSVPGVDCSSAADQASGSTALIKLATPSSPALPIWNGGDGARGRTDKGARAASISDADDEADDEANDNYHGGQTKGGGFKKAHRRQSSNSSAASNSSAGGGGDGGEQELPYMHTPARSDLPYRPAAAAAVPISTSTSTSTSNTTPSSFVEEDGYGVVGVLLEYGAYSDTDDGGGGDGGGGGSSSVGPSDSEFEFEFDETHFDADNNNRGGEQSEVRRLFEEKEASDDEPDADTTLIALDPAYLAATAAEVAAAEGGDDDDAVEAVGLGDDDHELGLELLSSSWSRLRKVGVGSEGRERAGSLSKQHFNAVVM